MNKALEILKKKGYYVRMERVDPTHYKVTYPAYTMMEQKSEGFTEEYVVDDKGFTVGGEHLDLPNYLKRLAILADVDSQIHYLHLNSTLLCYYGEDGKELESIFELIKAELQPAEAEIETNLYKMLKNEELPPEVQKKIFRNYKILKGLTL